MDSKFNAVVLRDCMKASLIGDNDVEIDNYLVAYKEILKFFQLMGTIFGFVSSDVKNKIEILEQLRAGEDREKFNSLNSMMDYEKSSGLLNKSNYVSGSRTFLRLHRGLDFIRLFLARVTEIEAKAKTSSVCQSAYDETLSNFHPFLIRKGARAAMYALPTKENLLKQLYGNEKDIEAAVAVVPEMLEVMGEVYRRSHSLYEKNDLHSLP